jgi:hypothetical protein
MPKCAPQRQGYRLPDKRMALAGDLLAALWKDDLNCSARSVLPLVQ